ncbi:hypothetical protein JZ751_006354 [Albula glossodonta]|uniref:Uncharacterized protein n=1 Tax=Albula glossodonta TaxID=121402 RepID=A0A8T2N4B4_9TELE|nr:hypothetical protein JZ751_006354 [Albula glossodonta]
MWIRKEEELLDKLGLDFLMETDSKRQTPGVPPPANFQKVFEREWSRREKAMIKIQEHNPYPGSGDALCESGSSEGAVSSTQEERSFQQEAVSQTQTPERVEGGEDVLLDFEKRIKEQGTTFKEVFEREWNRRELEIMEMVRKTVKTCTPLPARREGSMEYPPPYMGGDTRSEPDTYDVLQSCVKVYDWLREKNSAQAKPLFYENAHPA